ncbi:MAG: LmeA family phospholipid-binding protein [Jatrophihabitans sp.]|uniref:LmeA family phospholipid-binding protein n=1 Tax=Jatrophihabitans sp. TaxID=1932789 RepID=UPI003F8238F4
MLLVVLAVVAILALLALALPLLDRAAVAVAERTSSDFLGQPFGSPPVVRIHGTPFLTQALRGRYRSITVSGGGLRIGDMRGATLHARVVNAHLPLLALLGRRVTELPCEHLEGELVLPYGELARVSRIPYLTLDYQPDADGGRLVASAALPVPGISSLARLSGEAILSIVGGSSVWLRLGGVSVAGISVPKIVLDQLLGSLSVPIPLPVLPYGLRLADVRPTPAGLEVHGYADATRLTARPGVLASGA